MTKWKFVEAELIANSIRGAFQRANVYADTKTYTNTERRALRSRLTSLLQELAPQYASPVSNQQHKANIQKIADDLTSEFGERDLLHDNRFRIGIAQKALNLFLKYLWCLDKVTTPPHCPFDDAIIAKLRLTEQQKRGLQWTKLDSLAEYQILVDAGLIEMKTAKDPSLSDWELKQWKSG